MKVICFPYIFSARWKSCASCKQPGVETQEPKPDRTFNDHNFSTSCCPHSSLFTVSDCCNFQPSANFCGSEDALWTNLNQVQVISVGHQPKIKNVPASGTRKLKYSGFRHTPRPCNANYCHSWQRSAVNQHFSSCRFLLFGESQKRPKESKLGKQMGQNYVWYRKLSNCFQY